MADTKRNEIIEAAFRVFGELGYQSTTIKNIAEAAGMAPGSIYNYFADKEDLFKSTVEEGWADFLSTFGELVQSNRPLTDRLSALIDLGFQKLGESLPLLRGMLFESSQMHQFHKDLAKFCAYVEQLLDEGRKLGLLDIAEDGGDWKKLVKITVNGVLFSAALAPKERTEEEIVSLKIAVKRFVAERVMRREPA
jgi:AcrR family transcriptional regulator